MCLGIPGQIVDIINADDHWRQWKSLASAVR